MSQQLSTTIAVIGVDIGKNSFHVVGLDQRGAIVLRQKWSRGQVESRFANMPPCLIGSRHFERGVTLTASPPMNGHVRPCSARPSRATTGLARLMLGLPMNRRSGTNLH
jgi:hypothetical protein